MPWLQTFATHEGVPASSNQTALTQAVGTADGTVQDATATFSQTITNNNNAEFTTRINAMRSAMVGAGIMKGSA